MQTPELGLASTARGALQTTNKSGSLGGLVGMTPVYQSGGRGFDSYRSPPVMIFFLHSGSNIHCTFGVYLCWEKKAKII